MNAIHLQSGLRRLTAPNPSPMTLHGTNTFLIGFTDIAVIDPGPMIKEHGKSILASLTESQRISHILVTHSHRDHSPLAGWLADQTGAAIYAAGDSRWGRSANMQALAQEGLIGGGEGVDDAFEPNVQVEDGAVLEAPGWRIEAVHTPGHMANHVSFAWQDALFCGDLIMGWSTSLISPPDGDLTAFRASLNTLLKRDERIYYPAHGDAVENPKTRCRELLAHRDLREKQILDEIHKGPATPKQLTARIYAQIDPKLHPVAERNVLAHLIDLTERNLIAAKGDLSARVQFVRI